MPPCFIVPALSIGLSVAIGCAGPPAAPSRAVLEAADDARIAAMVTADTAALEPLLSVDLRYAHSNGTVDTKASLLDLVGSGRTRYVAYDVAAREFTFPAPGIALMTGRADVEVETAEGRRGMVLAYLAAWRLERGAWRFLAWQSARLPPPEGAPADAAGARAAEPSLPSN